LDRGGEAHIVVDAMAIQTQALSVIILSQYFFLM